MKIFNKIALVALASVALASCQDSYVDPVYYERADVDFT